MTKATRGRIPGLALFLACLTTNAYAAQQAGPTMDETRAWLASEGRDLMHVAASHLDTARNIKVQRRDSVDRIALDNCVLTWTMIRQTTISVGGQPSEDRTYTIDVTIAMKGLIASGLTVEPDTLFAD